jgi:RNA polymerase sigma factor (sigma-70 family)
MQKPPPSLSSNDSPPLTNNDAALLDVLKESDSVVSALATRYCHGDRSRKDDLRQEGLLAIVEAHRRFDKNKGSLSNFANRSAKGRMQNHRRSIRRWKQELHYDFSEGLTPSSESGENEAKWEDVLLGDESAHDRILKQVDIAFLHKAMQSRLTRQEQNVLEMLYTDDMTSVEVARRLQISAPRVTQIHQNAVRKLRAEMKVIQN